MKPHHCRCRQILDERDLFGLCSNCGRHAAWCPKPADHGGPCITPNNAVCPTCGGLIVYAIDDAGDVAAVDARAKVGGGHVLYFEQMNSLANPPQRVRAIPDEYSNWPFPSWAIHKCK